MSKKFAAFPAQLCLLILLLATLATTGAPQNPQNPPGAQTQRPRKVFPNEQEPEDVLRIDTDLVSVDLNPLIVVDGIPLAVDALVEVAS